ncbi:hypothetical protein [Streptomyces sulphureus]|uniref:hypothetical protein n=1 Tax=Streptomyces sulphureus TaxID=47758 RepID=UPI00037CD786|nr:hypothetical protein [Streptomyces sulphureus]
MNGPQHFREAERLADMAHHFTYGDGADSVTGAALAAEAQVHATLALAAATALVDETPRSDSHSEYRAWAEVAASDYRAPEPPRVH